MCEHKTSKKTLGSRDTHKTETRTCTQYHADPCAFCAPVCPCVRPGSHRPVPVYRKAWRVHTVYRYSRPRGAVDSGPAAVLAAVESVAVSAVAWSCGCVDGFGWMVVRFVRYIRVPACARVSRVSRVCPGSPRCLFTGTVPCWRSLWTTKAVAPRVEPQLCLVTAWRGERGVRVMLPCHLRPATDAIGHIQNMGACVSTVWGVI